MKASLSGRLAFVVCALLVAAFVAQGLVFIEANSQTFDEANYLAAGYSYLTCRDFRIMPEHPPLIKEWCALPVLLLHRPTFAPDPDDWERADGWRIGQQFLYDSDVPAGRLLTAGRLANLLLGAALVALVGRWAYRLWGPGAAVLGTALAAFEPNLVAHASLITTDLGTALFTCLTLYLLWEYVHAGSARLVAAAGVALGLGLATKHSAVIVAATVPLALAGHVLLGGSLPLPKAYATNRTEGVGAGLARAAVIAAGVWCVAVLVLLPVYFFQGFGAWWQGFLWQLNHRREGQAAFLLGEYSTEGWWHYFAVAFALKTPAGSILLIAAGLLLWRAGRRLGRRELVFLVLPAAVFFAALSRGRVNIGLRYLLPVYPLLFVLAARLATVRLGRAWVVPGFLAVPLTWTVCSSLASAPHQLAYFNEPAGGPDAGPRYLSDSNIDWGQDLKGLKEYVDREGLSTIYLSYFGTARPGAYGIRCEGLPGGVPRPLQPPPGDVAPPGGRVVLAVSVVNLQGTYSADRDAYRWLDGRAPAAKVGHSIYVYDLTDDADARRRLERLRREQGGPP